MSVDERMRIGLSRNAQSFTPDVDALFDAAVVVRRRRRRLGWAGATLGLAAAACAAVLVLPGGLGPDRGAQSGPAASVVTAVDVRGRFAGEVAALESAPSVAGSWVLEFQEAGVLAVTAPPAYPGVVSGVLYAVEGDDLRTDLFSQDLCSGRSLGRYRVSRTAAGLTLTAVEEPCAARGAVLGRTTWTSVP